MTLKNLSETAKELGISPTQMCRWERKGILKPVYRVGSTVRFDPDDCRQQLVAASEFLDPDPLPHPLKGVSR